MITTLQPIPVAQPARLAVIYRSFALVVLCSLMQLSAASYNNRLSSREIAFNHQVELTFNTPKVQRAVDIRTSLQQQLASFAVRDQWAVTAIEHNVHEKMGDVSIRIVLRPRLSGSLQAPELVPEWLENPTTIRPPSVLVHDHIMLGSEQLPTPVEALRVHGFPWNMPRKELSETYGITTTANTDGLFPVKSGLLLGFVNGRLGEAHLRLERVSLSAALPSLQQRWGTSTNMSDDHVEWLLGWVSIRAEADGAHTKIILSHEGIRRQAEAARVETQVFSLLDDPGSNQQEANRTRNQLEQRFEQQVRETRETLEASDE